MGFQSPLYLLSEYIKWTTEGEIQLPDFQREYKWEDERIRQLLITVLRGHPMGIVMLLQTGNNEIHFKPRPVEGTHVPAGTPANYLLLDGQQRLTSLTQSLTGDGIVSTTDSRGKMLDRRYYVDMRMALEGEDRMDEAVISVPGDGVEKTDFGRVILRDYSTAQKEREAEMFPLRLLYGDAMSWLFELGDRELAKEFNEKILKPASTYDIPAIELDRTTSKAAVATVFEKVNTGGLPLNVFELLTATFAGDKSYFDKHGTSFRLNDDWRATQERFRPYPVLAGLESTDFLQAVSLLATRERHNSHDGPRPPAISAKREDILKLSLDDYLKWVEPLREAFVWCATFLADRYIFDRRFLPYQTQLVPLAAMRVILGSQADLIGPREKLVRWYWSGILGELYGGSVETRFVRDVEQVPPWVLDPEGSQRPKTISDANFVESRLHSLRTRNAAAYKGIYALLLANGARDWMEDRALDKVQYTDLAVDIHHIFPKKWCAAHGIDTEHTESIVNKTPISAVTNRTIGGAAPSRYLQTIERKAQISAPTLDRLLEGHLVSPAALREDDFETFFTSRREALCELVEKALGKEVSRDIQRGEAVEDSSQFELERLSD